MAGPIYAEILSGTKTRASHEQLADLLEGLNRIPEPPDAWEQVALARFTLAREGFQASLVDLLIAVVAASAGHSILTRDHDFERIVRVIPFELEVF